ncbi:AAA family ATPase [Novosphingobium sp. 1949]|uniref:AAA family ATPase n=1 Tax=Novosphingobium organovorum TaxID=2930092 RepID=A0ABT0BID5_9SPHN|nr:AAA family ATPase [Novosphingobium organovorum]MCJ2184695.1 AAA family ATPase [Novosphingobium organovorum]
MTSRTDPIRLPAETRYAAELAALSAQDSAPRPAGWQLSPRAVRRFLLGDATLGIARKFYGDDPLVDRAIVSLMSQQGLMLVGEPGTAKSLLSELLTAAISGTSALVVQGSAGTNEDHIRYGWNYALLLAEGPSERALVPSPVLSAMRQGRIVRFEEITRCPPEVQDALISILSEKALALPELGADAVASAAPGFNIIATANLRDRGVHEMSSALKRRFNFETVHPIADPAFERELVLAQLAERLGAGGIAVTGARETAEVLVQTFSDLRCGRTTEGVALNRPDAVLSTAEAVNVLHAAALEAAYLDEGQLTGAHVARQLQGVVLKDCAEDGKRLRAYVEHIAKERAGRSAAWKAFYQSARTLRLD